MFLRTFLAALLLSSSVVAQDCTADVDLAQRDGLKLDVTYKCRSAAALQFVADGDRVARRVTEFRDGSGHEPTPSANAWRVEPLNGVVEAR